MSVRDTTILDRKDLRYLLIDSLRLYSDNVAFIDGNNPYRFSINKKTYYVLIKNVHESGTEEVIKMNVEFKLQKHRILITH